MYDICKIILLYIVVFEFYLHTCIQTALNNNLLLSTKYPYMIITSLVRSGEKSIYTLYTPSPPPYILETQFPPIATFSVRSTDIVLVFLYLISQQQRGLYQTLDDIYAQPLTSVGSPVV